MGMVPFKKHHEHEYGVKACSSDPNTGDVSSAKCLFCVYFGRECDDANRKRKATANVKYFSAPFRVQNYKSHLRQHEKRYAEYNKLSMEEKAKYFAVRGETFVNTLEAQLDINLDRRDVSYVLDAPVVETILDQLMYDSEDDNEMISKERALRVFTKADDGTYKVNIRNYRQHVLIREYVSCGAPFRLVISMMQKNRSVTNVDNFGCVNMQNVIENVRITVAIALQWCSEIMKAAWAYSIALEESNKGTSAYLDIRVRVPCDGDIQSIHLLAIPMFDRHTGDHMFEILSKLLDSMDDNWKTKIIGVTTDGAKSMAANQRSVATSIEEVALPAFHRLWCASHQLDLSVQKSVIEFFNDELYSSLTEIIGFLRRETDLIQEMNSKCPKITDTRWQSLGKVAKWLLFHRERIEEYLAEKNPACAPPKKWWLYLGACDAVMRHVDGTFVAGQGLSTLIVQQLHDLEKVCKELIFLANARRPQFNSDAQEDSIVTIGDYAVSKPDAEAMIKDLGLFFEEIYSNELSEEQKLQVCSDVSNFVLTLVDEIKKIKAQSDLNGSQDLPLVLPHQLLKMRSHEFNAILSDQSPRYLRSRTRKSFQAIQEEHRELLRVYRSETILHEQIEKHNERTSFADAWQPLEGRFETIKEFCAGLASVFPGTSTVESDSSVINYEKNYNRTALTDLSLEGILQSKQFVKLQGLHETLP